MLQICQREEQDEEVTLVCIEKGGLKNKQIANSCRVFTTNGVS